MTKPDDVSQEAWDDAMVCIGLVGMPTEDQLQLQRANVARAIMAAKAEEREACANIADSKISGGYYDGAPVWADGNEIAAAIRKRGEEE